jgi:hypothetical protein
MAEAYLANELADFEEIQPLLENVTSNAMEGIAGRLYDKKLAIAAAPTNLDLAIANMTADIEENLRIHKVVEAERRKKELEDKLEYVNSNIEELTSKKLLSPMGKAGHSVHDISMSRAYGGPKYGLHARWMDEENEESATLRQKFVEKMSETRRERKKKRLELRMKMKKEA